MEGFFQTDIGKIRKINEDDGGVHLNQAKQYLAIIADGMGGHQAGEVASELTVKTFSEAWSNESEIMTAHTAEKWIVENVSKANNKIIEYANNNKECNGMGTTIVVAICTNDFITVGHIGDSRAYLSNQSGFKQITEDHSLVNELLKSGEINSKEAKEHPQKNVLLKALGTDSEIKPEIKTINWDINDRLLLCSDGLSNKIVHDELASIVKNIDSEADMNDKLITLANERGGEDNITTALIIKRSSSEVGDY